LNSSAYQAAAIIALLVAYALSVAAEFALVLARLILFIKGALKPGRPPPKGG
jgi:hypothetical protein